MRFNKYYAFAVLSAAVACWGFFSINSWFVDNHGISNVWCVLLGIAGVLGVAYFLRKV